LVSYVDLILEYFWNTKDDYLCRPPVTGEVNCGLGDGVVARGREVRGNEFCMLKEFLGLGMEVDLGGGARDIISMLSILCDFGAGLVFCVGLGDISWVSAVDGYT
jgi:hypothetical protein